MSIPATPMPGTADPNPLVSVADYQLYTQDLAPSAASVSGAITRALSDVQQFCKRTLLYGQYSENVFVNRTGMVYPSAVPVDLSMPPSSNASDADNSIFQGWGIWVGWFIPLPSLPVWQGVVPPQTDILYWGGYSGSSSVYPPVGGTSGEPIPSKLCDAICKTAWYYLHPGSLPAMPGGVKSLSQGGVHLTAAPGGFSSFMRVDRQLRKDLQGFKRRLGKDWGDGSGPGTKLKY